MNAARAPLTIICTFTESPSFNVRVLYQDSEIFYNSERLEGNERTRQMGKILNLTSFKVGTYQIDVTQDQINRIMGL